MELKRLEEILQAIQHVRIGVVGDFCLDAYWHLDTGAPEHSIETGKPTHAVRAQRYFLGGAGNVVNNLIDLGAGSVHAFGVISDDLFGREMLVLLNRRHVEAHGMLIQSNDWDTPVYAKPYRGAVEQQRIDFGRFNRIAEGTETQLINAMEVALPTLDALIINQQLARGVCSSRIVGSLNGFAADFPAKIFVLDSRNRTEEFQGMICKLNTREAARVCGEASGFAVEQLRHYAESIALRMQKPVFITRSGQGILVFDGKTFHTVPAVEIAGPIDPVGAGDTTVAAIAAAIAAGSTAEEAAVFANLTAAITVQKLQQTGTASPMEIRALAVQLHPPQS